MRFGPKRPPPPIAGLLLLCALCWPAAGQAGEEAEKHENGHANEVAVFFGFTDEGRDEGFALGVEYERRLNESYGVGALAERTWRGRDFWVYAIPLTLHVERWKFVVAGGVERGDGNTEGLLRLAAGYEFEVGTAAVTPTLAVDSVDGELIYIVGASVGFGF